MSPAVNQIYIAVVGKLLSCLMSFADISLGFIAHVFVLMRSLLKKRMHFPFLFFCCSQVGA